MIDEVERLERLQHSAAVRVTAVDLAEVLPVTRKAVEAAGMGKAFSFAAHDVLAGPFAHEAFDLAVAANLFHLFGEDDCRRLAAHLHAALRPGGRIAIVDVVPNGGRTSAGVLSYALGLMLRTTNGRVYPFTAFASWLRDAGFRAVERVELDARHAIAAVLAMR